MARTAHTVVHVVRHGEVYNPEGVLYGRLPGFRLSELGRAMAERVGENLAQRNIAVVRASPLQRAQETAQPLATRLGLGIDVEHRIIESTNRFEGMNFGPGNRTLLDPSNWPLLWNPVRPSWGEAYVEVAARMRSAILDARNAARDLGPGIEAALISHQLPIWISRLSAEGRPFVHNPRSRECTLASVTSYHFDDAGLVKVGYAEPAGDLIPAKDRKANFSAGGAGESPR